MKPVFFSFGTVELSSYALMLSVGACCAVWLTQRESLRKGLDPAAMLNLSLLIFAAGVVGGRALTWILYRDLYENRPWWWIFEVWRGGGSSIYGGLLLATAVGLAYMRHARLPAWDTADTLALGWLPFLFFVRIGCFLNGCCYGRPTTSPFGLVAGGAPDNVNFGVPSHPAQLYSVVAALAAFAVLWWLRTRNGVAGRLAVTFLLLYAVFRFLLGFVRGDTGVAFRFGELGILGLNQVLSVLLFVFAAIAAVVLARRNRQNKSGVGLASRPAP